MIPQRNPANIQAAATIFTANVTRLNTLNS